MVNLENYTICNLCSLCTAYRLSEYNSILSDVCCPHYIFLIRSLKMTQLGNNPPQNPRGRNKLVLKSPGTFVGGAQIYYNPISNHIHTTTKFREKK